MKNFVIFYVCLLASIVCPCMADEPLQIATTLATYADIAKTIGGERVSVSNVASPRFNPHFIEPKPSDVLKVKRSALFIHSGLDLEAWRGPLIDAAARSDLRAGGAAQLDLSMGIKILEVPDHAVSRAEGDIHLSGNPHYWISPENGLIIAQEITQKLQEMDPGHASEYKANLEKFSGELQQKINGWRAKLLPFKGSEFVGYHNEWVYLMQFSGLSMKQFVEPKPGIPPSPKQLSFLEEYITTNKIKGVIRASFYPADATDYLHEKTSVPVLTLCQNVNEIPECSTYGAMVDYNLGQILKGLSK